MTYYPPVYSAGRIIGWESIPVYAELMHSSEFAGGLSIKGLFFETSLTYLLAESTDLSTVNHELYSLILSQYPELLL